MALRKTIGLGTLSLALTGLLVSGGAAADHADGWAWKYRLLVVFAPATDDSGLERQRHALAGATADLLERHMAVVEIIDGKTATTLGKPLGINASAVENYLGKTDTEFEVVLFGKDTGVKLRARQPVSAEDIFALIDTMPMRRRELRQQGG